MSSHGFVPTEAAAASPTVPPPEALPWDLKAMDLGLKLLTFLNRHFIWVLLFLAALFGFSYRYTIGINASSSLPHTLYLIDKSNKKIERGAYVSFRWHGAGPYGKGVSFTKQVRGVPGDVVTQQDSNFYVNGEFMGKAKPRSTTGQLLQPGPTGVIPPQMFYVFAPNPDSLDSRYALTGWIKESAVLGRAIVIF